MSRPRIPIGTFGEIGFINRPGGRVEARTRFRDWDGQTRLIQATASSKAAAEVALKKRLAERTPSSRSTPRSRRTARFRRWSTTG
jgi:hypothetical protein